MGRSVSENASFARKRFCPASLANTSPSAEVNSVNITSGPPARNASAGKLPLEPTPISRPPYFEYFAINRRNAASVTSSMGARAKNGRGSFVQKLLMSSTVPLLFEFIVHAIPEAHINIIEFIDFPQNRVRRQGELQISHERARIVFERCAEREPFGE